MVWTVLPVSLNQNLHGTAENIETSEQVLVCSLSIFICVQHLGFWGVQVGKCVCHTLQFVLYAQHVLVNCLIMWHPMKM